MEREGALKSDRPGSQFPAQPPTGSATLGKAVSLAEPQGSHLSKGMMLFMSHTVGSVREASNCQAQHTGPGTV